MVRFDGESPHCRHTIAHKGWTNDEILQRIPRDEHFRQNQKVSSPLRRIADRFKGLAAVALKVA